MCVCVCACEHLLHGLIPLSVIPLSYDHQEPTLDFSLLKGNVAHGKSPPFEGALSMRARTPLAAAVPARRARPPPPPPPLIHFSHTHRGRRVQAGQAAAPGLDDSLQFGVG